MAKIIAIRKTLPGEPGEILVDADIYRPSAERNVRVKWLLGRTEASGHYRVVGGCTTGLDLHSQGDIVLMRPIAENVTYSHILLGTDKG